MAITVGSMVRVKRFFVSDPKTYRFDHGYVLTTPVSGKVDIHFVDGKTATVSVRDISS